jgi:chromosome segregation ATPase
MSDIYETNAPIRFPSPREQPEAEDDSGGGSLKAPPVKETVNRWKKDVIDKIQYLRDNLEQAHQEKESLTLEMDRLQSELTNSKGRIKELEVQLSEALETFNTLLNEVSSALEG